MNQNPYTPPQSELVKPIDIEVPPGITKKIKNAWVAGLISITITVLLTVISISGNPILGLDATAFIDVGLMSIFVYGIYKNSRVSAILMLLLFLSNKILMWVQSGTLTGLPLAIVFFWFYTQGVVGTIQYHRHVNSSH